LQPQSGTVGIGTTSPTATLEVSGTVSATRFVGNGSGLTGVGASDRISSTNNQAMAVATSGGTVSFTLGGTAGAAYLHPSLGLVASGVSTTGGISGTSGYFSGNVGIGTTAPDQRLTVAGRIQSKAGSPEVWFYETDQTLPNGLWRWTGYTGNFWLQQNTAEAGDFSSATERLVISSSGNVGIGTTAPDSLLEIRKDQAAETNLTISNRNTSTNSGAGLIHTGIVFNGYRDTEDPYALAAIKINSNRGGRADDLAHGGDMLFYTQPGTASILERMRITSAGKVGIGTATPTTTLEVSGTVSATRFVGNGSGLTGVGASDRISSTNNQAMAVATSGGTVSFTLGGTAGAAYLHPTLGLVASGVSATGGISGTSGYFSGNVGIGTTSPNAKLGVSGIVSATGITITGDISYTGILTDISDRRRKEDIHPLGSGMLDKVAALKPVSFRMKGDARREYGFIAQDVQPVFPELVTGDAGPSGTLALNYSGFIAPMAAAIQELRAEVAALRRENEELRRRLH
jgi:hypothetical protein